MLSFRASLWVDVVSEARHGTPSVGGPMLRIASNIASYQESPGVCSVKKCVFDGGREFLKTPVSLGETFGYVLGRATGNSFTYLSPPSSDSWQTICVLFAFHPVQNFVCIKIEA